MATALDVIGDRWTILILRELLGGAARFHELQEGLPGIAKNLLTDRLRRLEGDGIVRRVRSHNAVLYALTERGAAARAAVEALGFWGATLEPVVPPAETMLGALMAYVHGADPGRFQPMNANFGLLPPLEERVRDKRRRRELLAERAVTQMRAFAAGAAAVAT